VWWRSSRCSPAACGWPAPPGSPLSPPTCRNHAYHQLHVDVLPTVSNQILQTITLSLVSVTAILLAALAFRLPVRPAAPVPSIAAAPSVT
jgi:hypothetical protein